MRAAAWLALFLILGAGSARAQGATYVLECGSAGCTADDGTAQAPYFVLNREVWASPPTSRDPNRIYVPDIGQSPALTAAQNSLMLAMAPFPAITGLAISNGHIVGTTSGTPTLDPGVPATTCLASTGVVSGCKRWVGIATTTSGGLFTVDYTSASFAAPPRVRVQAYSPDATVAHAYVASVMTPGMTSASGIVVQPTSTTVVVGGVVTPYAAAGAGVVVSVSADGP